MWLVPKKVLNTSAIADVRVQCAERVFWVVGRGQERSPACLLDSRRVAVVITWHGTESVVCDCGGVKRSVDRSDRSPKQVVVLGMMHRHHCIGSDDVDHCRQPCCVEQAEAARSRDVATDSIVLADHVRRPELRDKGLLVAAQTAGRGAVGLGLMERFNPLIALKRRRWIGQELVEALHDKSANAPDPRRLRRREWRRQSPHARGWRQRGKRRRRSDRGHPPIARA